MAAGINLIVRVWRYSYPQDDAVGGAVPSGTILYEGVRGRIEDAKPIPAFIAEGLQTKKVLRGLVIPGTLNIQEYDQLEVTSPPNHHYYGQMFRVDSVERENYHPSDPRGNVLLSLTRETRHGNQYQ